MNAHQRRKRRRTLQRSVGDGSQHHFVRHWEDLAQVPASETHYLEIDVEGCNGWIHRKESGRFETYLSTHTFYGSMYLRSTEVLRRCGFNVTLENWDKPNRSSGDSKSSP